MSYLVLARKWRPKSFAEMVGQGHVLQALTNALDKSRLHHAYLFTGTRGVGKTTVARIFAKALNCEQGISSTPCGVCSACVEIDQGRFVDLIEVDAASRTGVDDTRELLDNIAYAPVRGRFKIYLIDEVHMFSKSSFNALLKTLEEPPEHVKFLLATTDPQKLPVTVLSRCLQFNLRALPATQIHAHLADVLRREQMNAEPAGLHLIAEAANGSMRDALSLLDQAIAFTGGKLHASEISQILGLSDHHLIWAMLEALAEERADRLFQCVEDALDRAVEPVILLTQLIEAIHQLSLQQWIADSPSMVQIPDTVRTIDAETLQLWYQIAGTGRRDMAWAPNARIGLEMTLLRMLAFSPTMPDNAVRQAREIQATEDTRAFRPLSPVLPEVVQPTHSTNRSERGSDEPKRAAAAAKTHLLREINDEQWHTLVDRIRVGAARSLASNCHVQMKNGQIHLVFAPEFEVLASQKTKENLLNQLADVLDIQNVKFTMAAKTERESSLGDSPEKHTPAERKTLLEQNDQQQRKESILQHPAVGVLQAEASAVIVEESITAIDDSELNLT
jgi:DNA polymerase-3 subunit gamma/tau